MRSSMPLSTQTRVDVTEQGDDPPPSRSLPHEPTPVDLERAYRELAPRVLGYLRGAGVPDPENMLGEVFVSVVQAAHRFRGDDDALRRWVFSIAHNRIVDAHRRRQRRPLIAVADPPDQPVVDPERPDPDLLCALAGLPEDQRTVVALRFVADLPLADVAAVLDRSTEAVKKLQQRGLANLRRALGGGEPT